MMRVTSDKLAESEPRQQANCRFVEIQENEYGDISKAFVAMVCWEKPIHPRAWACINWLADISDDLRLLERSRVECPSGTVCSARGIMRVVITNQEAKDSCAQTIKLTARFGKAQQQDREHVHGISRFLAERFGE